MDEISPPTLKGYRMCGALGTGGGSVIYAIDEIKTGKRFALKYVEALSARHRRFFEQVTAEHNLAKNVKHPVLRKTFKLERRGLLTTHAMLLYMDFVDGRPLTALQHSDASRALLALAKAAEGLRAIHRMGYVHADLNPKNVLVGKKGEVRLIDYGQACKIGTAKKRVQGTIDYISPEQLVKAPLDARTDVFSLGACMYWAVTHKTIGPPSVQAKGGRRIGSRDFPPPMEVNPLVAEGLNTIIMGCLEEVSSDRPSSIDEILQELHQEVRELLQAEAAAARA